MMGADIVFGAVGKTLAGAVWRSPVYQVAPGQILMTVPGLARVLVPADGPSVLDVHRSSDDLDVAWLVNRPIASLRRLHKAQFGLRAAAVVVDGCAVALAGPGAAGKSATAAVLARRGHLILADGDLVIGESLDVSRQARVRALDLWPDVADFLEREPGSGAVVRSALTKRAFAFEVAEAKVALGALVVLARDTRVGELQLEPIACADRLSLVLRLTNLRGLHAPLGLDARAVAWAGDVAGGVRMHRLTSDRHAWDLDEVADVIEGHVR